MIKFTQSAKTQIYRLLSDKDDSIGLRLSIKGGGCSGLKYQMDFTKYREGDIVIEIDTRDITEENLVTTGFVAQNKYFNVYLDPKSFIYLKDTTVDYNGGLQGRGFTFQNPLASNSCGCGESFAL